MFSWFSSFHCCNWKGQRYSWFLLLYTLHVLFQKTVRIIFAILEWPSCESFWSPCICHTMGLFNIKANFFQLSEILFCNSLDIFLSFPFSFHFVNVLFIGHSASWIFLIFSLTPPPPFLFLLGNWETLWTSFSNLFNFSYWFLDSVLKKRCVLWLFLPLKIKSVLVSWLWYFVSSLLMLKLSLKHSLHTRCQYFLNLPFFCVLWALTISRGRLLLTSITGDPFTAIIWVGAGPGDC